VARSRKSGNLEVVTYPLHAVVDIVQLAAALQVSERTIERMDLPTIYIGPRTRRYIMGQVLEALRDRAK